MIRKYINVLLLFISVSICCITMNVNAAEEFSGTCGEHVTWVLDTEGILTLSGTGDMDDYGINHEETHAPWFWESSKITNVKIGEGITSIGERAFYFCTNLKNIEIPEHVDRIGRYAFSMCTNLQSIMIPDSVTSIESNAFENCASLKNLEIGKGVSSIGTAAFGNCSSLTGLWVDEENMFFSNDERGVLFNKAKTTLLVVPGTISGEYQVPEGVTIIGENSFSNATYLECIKIPSSVINIGEPLYQYFPVFKNSTALKKICVDVNNEMFSSDDSGVLFSKDKSILMEVPSNVQGQYVVPDGVVAIESYAFKNCHKLKEIAFANPYKVTTIKLGAFVDCIDLTDITLPNGLTIIYSKLFSGCIALTSINIPHNIVEIYENAFDGCVALKDIVFEWNAPSSMDKKAFEGVTASAYYPEGNATWTEDVMQQYGGTITWTSYKSDIFTIGSGTCGENIKWKLTNDGVLTIFGIGTMKTERVPWKAYREDIKKIVIEEGVLNIEEYAFNTCVALAEVSISESVTIIGERAFMDCAKLSTITIPKSVTTIGSRVFEGCDSLTTIIFEGDAPNMVVLFTWGNVDAYYPAGNPTWSKVITEYHGGTISWVPYGESYNGWVQKNASWYYYIDNVMQTGWQYIDNAWYYLDNNGIMQTDWQYINGVWYYLASSGAMLTGWQYIGNVWYYFNGSGAMQTGWQHIGSAWYYFSGSGAMLTGWQYIGSVWYYFSGSGAMLTGWQYIGNAWYYFNSSGAMAAGCWVGNYYLQADGAMATNMRIGIYYVGADGCWIPGR